MDPELIPGPTAFYRRKGKWHVITCPGADPKLVVVGKTEPACRWRAEALFNVVIPEPRPEAA